MERSGAGGVRGRSGRSGRGRWPGAPLAAGCAALFALAAPLSGERPPLRRFTQADGLAGDYVAVVRQDSRGFLWFGSDDGVARFDGATFRNYGAADGVPDGIVADILETRDGELLFATGGGVCRFREPASADEAPPRAASRRVRFDCDLPEGRPEGAEVRALHEDRRGRLWAATAAGLFAIERSAERLRFAAVPLAVAPDPWAEAAIREIVEQPGAGIWLATSLGVARIAEDGRTFRYRVSGFGHDERIFALALDSGGRLWIGHVNDGVFVWLPPPDFEPPLGWSIAGVVVERRQVAGERPPREPIELPDVAGEAIRIGHADGLDDERARTGILEDRDGAVWIGTVRGLARLAEGRLARFGREHGLPDDGTRPSLVDRAGNLWFGSPSGGAARWKRSGFTSYDALDGLRGHQVRSIFEGRDGAVHVLSTAERDYLQRFDGERFEAVSPELPEGIAYAGWWIGQVAVEARDGSWWLPTGLRGLARFAAPGRFAALDRARAIDLPGEGPNRSLGPQVVYEDRAGDLWIGSFTPPWLAVRRGSTGKYEAFGEEAGVPPAAPLVFREDEEGRLWIGFGDGTIGRLLGGRLARLEPAGRPAWSAVYDLRFDGRGALWAATIGAGLVRFATPDEPRGDARAWTTADGLPSNELTCLVADERGRIWAGTSRGVARLDPDSGEVRRFTTADGLANNVVRALFRDRRGDLWLGTFQGLSRLRAAPDRAPPEARVVLTSIEVGGVPRPLAEHGASDAGAIRSAPGADRLRVGFVAPGADLDEAPLYRYRLEGLDASWSAPTRDRAVTWAGLPAGRYRFEVVAVGERGGEEGAPPTPAGFDLWIRPPLWRSGWALALYALSALAAVWLVHRARVARLLAVERVRTRIAADLHDDLGASLSRIAILSEVASQRGSAEAPHDELIEIADTARRITEEAGDIVWSIDPRRDDLASLLVRVRPLAADLLGERGVELDWLAPADAASIRLPPDARRHLLLVLKEAVHNAARHAGARRVVVRIEAPREAIRIEVADDGVGFDPEQPPASAGGRGLPSLRARAAELGGRLAIRSSPGEGTTVALEIPR